MRLRTLAGAVCAWALWSGAPAAQQAPEAELALAREILELTNALATMNASMDSLTPALIADLQSRGVSERNARRLAELYLQEFADEYDSVMELTAIAYAEAFDQAELTDIRDFYATPSGIAFARAAPELTAALTRAGMAIGEEAMARALERFEQERRRERGPS